MKNWRAIFSISLAVVVALTASFILYKWLQKQRAPKEVVKVEVDAVPVVVVAADLPWGTKLKPEMIKSTPYLKESLPPGYFSDLEAITGRVLIVSLKQNEAILEDKLAPNSVTTGGVSAVIPVGKRALAVKGDKVLGISGFIKPGDRVDVLLTLSKKKMEITKTVLENVLVLATGKEIQENDKGDPSPVDVYTLEVTPEEGEQLALAASEGKLHFALRNVTDHETVLTKGATVAKALSSFRPPVPPQVRRSRAAVQVIKGSKSQKVNF